MNSFTTTVKNIFKVNGEEKSNLNPGKFITAKEINSALSKLDGQDIECSDIVYRNKDSIKKTLKKIFIEKTEEVENKSYSIICINKYKSLLLYYNLDSNAFLNIAYSLAHQFGFDINSSVTQEYENNINKNGKYQYLMLMKPNPLKNIF